MGAFAYTGIVAVSKSGVATMSRRVICSIFFLIITFHVTSFVQAQTDYTFSRWLADRNQLDDSSSLCKLRLFGSSPRHQEACEKRQAKIDKQQYEKDKAEANKRGISIKSILAERLEQKAIRLAEAEARRQLAREEKARKKEQFILAGLAIAAALLVALIVLTYRARKRIAAATSLFWWSRSRAFRMWAYGSVCWALATFLYVSIVESFDAGGWEYMDEGVVLHTLSIMIVPPIFIGTVWFGYRRFV